LFLARKNGKFGKSQFLAYDVFVGLTAYIYR